MRVVQQGQARIIVPLQVIVVHDGDAQALGCGFQVLQAHRLAEQGLETNDIYESLAIDDIAQNVIYTPRDGFVGTDTFAAELVAREIADRLDAVYAPFGPYGVTPIHAGHPGSVTLRRETFEALLTAVCTSG